MASSTRGAVGGVKVGGRVFASGRERRELSLNLGAVAIVPSMGKSFINPLA